MLTNKFVVIFWFFGAGILTLIIFATLFFVGFFRSSDVSVSKLDKQQGLFLLEYPKEYNIRQSGTTCGPYSVAAVLRVFGDLSVSSMLVAENISYKTPSYGTHPRGLEKAIEDADLVAEGYKLTQAGVTDERRLNFIREQLIAGNPVILLGKKKGVQHYVTVLGVNLDNGSFYLYDSWYDEGEPGLTRDDNNEFPGNITWTETELLDFWREGGVFGAYTWYALVAHK